MPSYGDVALAAGGIYSSKPRPVLIVQNDQCFTGDSTMVIPFTSVHNPATGVRTAIRPLADSAGDVIVALPVYSQQSTPIKLTLLK